MNTYQALRVLNVKQDSSQDMIKTAYRKLALEVHPDKNKYKKEDTEFKKITEAYTHLKKNHTRKDNSTHQEYHFYLLDYQAGPQDQWPRFPGG